MGRRRAPGRNRRINSEAGGTVLRGCSPASFLVKHKSQWKLRALSGEKSWTITPSMNGPSPHQSIRTNLSSSDRLHQAYDRELQLRWLRTKRRHKSRLSIMRAPGPRRSAAPARAQPPTRAEAPCTMAFIIAAGGDPDEYRRFGRQQTTKDQVRCKTPPRNWCTAPETQIRRPLR